VFVGTVDLHIFYPYIKCLLTLIPNRINSLALFLQLTMFGSALLYFLYVQLVGPDICRQHCAIEYVTGSVIIMPLDRVASVYVNNLRICSAAALSHGASVLVGSQYLFQFIDPMTSQVCLVLF